MSEFTIEKGIPVPKQVGDSFFVKDGTVKTLSRSCGTYGKRLERKFTSRTVDGGARVWRVE